MGVQRDNKCSRGPASSAWCGGLGQVALWLSAKGPLATGRRLCAAAAGARGRGAVALRLISKFTQLAPPALPALPVRAGDPYLAPGVWCCWPFYWSHQLYAVDSAQKPKWRSSARWGRCSRALRPRDHRDLERPPKSCQTTLAKFGPRYLAVQDSGHADATSATRLLPLSPSPATFSPINQL